jgi:hypothetical protein
LIGYRGPEPVELSLIDDRLRPASEMRAVLNVEAIQEYAHILMEMPPVKLMWDRKEGRYWVTDGAHTLTALAGTGQTIVRAMVADGDYLEAFRAASAENVRHGVRITKADKRARLERACRALPGLVDDWPWSSARLGEFCGVGHHLAGEVLECVQGEMGLDPDTPRTSSNGAKRSARWTDARRDVASNGGSGPGRASGGNPDGRNPPSFQPGAKPRPSPYKTLQSLLDEIQVLVGSVNAPDTADHQGWGGFAAVAARLSAWERRHILDYLGSLVDSLQEWLLVLHEVSDDRGSEEV